MPVVNVDVEFHEILLGHLTAEADTEYLILQETQLKLHPLFIPYTSPSHKKKHHIFLSIPISTEPEEKEDSSWEVQ